MAHYFHDSNFIYGTTSFALKIKLLYFTSKHGDEKMLNDYEYNPKLFMKRIEYN